MKEQICRIEEMELALDRATSAVDAMEKALERYRAAQDDIRLLEGYLNSEERRADLEADEAGKLPSDLRRGVLSEDAIWNLLDRKDELDRDLKN